jgi:energy-coupling factor transporter ATP-binding protein EcfA2
MRLVRLSYKEFEGKDQEWILDDLTLGARNLLVGKNATGKSRTLNVIGALAKILSGQRAPTLVSGDFVANFDHNGSKFKYHMHMENENVLMEELSVDDRILLQRGAGGVGYIFAKEIDGGKNIPFQSPQNELAAAVRRDAIQHPFLQPLFDWASAVRHYHFGTPLGKDNFTVIVPKGARNPSDADDKDATQVVAIYQKAVHELPEGVFRKHMLADLERVGYPADEISVGAPISIRLRAGLAGELLCLLVKEKGLRSVTDQNTMSQGMFRVLSLLVLTNYLLLAKKAGCILVDDIGEGLDFDRSCLLVDLMREKADHSRIQLIMSTNDKFVMNKVPLEEWSVLQRRGNHVHVLNYVNSRKLFEEFRFTGLSNFSFLEMGFGNDPPTEDGSHE